jgi:methylenetetrahydrofolate dehydrogenase (NADP+)/methenyltetrahydrofolate cyclohydrolase
MTKIFDGRAFAAKREEELIKRVVELKKKSKTPKLVSIIVGGDPASHLYVNLKMKAGARVGLEVQIFGIAADWSDEKIGEHKEEILSELKARILEFVDHGVDGIMIQLPLPEPLRDKTGEILMTIPEEKDVDGLREDSPYLHPTSMAVVQILLSALRGEGMSTKTVAVVGATGMVGRPLVRELSELGFEVDGLSRNSENFDDRVRAADIVISAAGRTGIIAGDMVKAGAIVIDVGAPKGDVDFESVSRVAAFITPVPGGVGPVTITCLLENLVVACEDVS